MKKTLTRIGIFTLILFVCFYMYLSWFFSGLILHPDLEQRKERVAAIEDIRKNGPKPGSAMAAIKAPYEEFELKMEDGVVIKGWHFIQSDTSTCAAIISHGWTSSRVGALNFAHVFDSCGCDIVVYDHRVHGESTGDFAGGGDVESKDLIAITDWLVAKTGLKDNQIGWVGISWGGATVLEAGGTGREMAFIWSDAPFQDWHTAIFERAIRDYGSWVKILPFGVYAAYNIRTGFHPSAANAAEAAKNIKVPVFLFHSKTDEATGSQQSVNINKNLNPEKSVFVHGEWGGLHGKDIVDNKDVYSASFYDFLKKYAPNFGKCQE